MAPRAARCRLNAVFLAVLSVSFTVGIAAEQRIDVEDRDSIGMEDRTSNSYRKPSLPSTIPNTAKTGTTHVQSPRKLISFDGIDRLDTRIQQEIQNTYGESTRRLKKENSGQSRKGGKRGKQSKKDDCKDDEKHNSKLEKKDNRDGNKSKKGKRSGKGDPICSPTIAPTTMSPTSSEQIPGTTDYPTLSPESAATKHPTILPSTPPDSPTRTPQPSISLLASISPTSEPVEARTVHPTVQRECLPSANECCEPSECSDGSVCEGRWCVLEGSLRFTLSWYGSSDFNLGVQAPGGGSPITAENRFDYVSGGRLEEDVVPDSIGYWTENIYFPSDDSVTAGGSYLIQISTRSSDVQLRSGLPVEEEWTITMNQAGEMVTEFTGNETSKVLGVFVDSEIPVTASPAPPPLPTIFTPAPSYPANECSPLEFECCVSDDCPAEQGIQSCPNRNCVTGGMPRFTLKWIGSGDIDLRVRTPDGTPIYFLNPFDSVSGGVLEEDVVPSGFGYWVENIYFPEGPDGNYLYGVSGSNQEWEIDVYIGDELVEQQRGVGLSSDFLLLHGECDINSSESVQCCTGEDCGSNEFDCANQKCIFQGNLRFSLLWEGVDDKDLFVITPGGAVIGYQQSPFDEVTGGQLEEDVQPKEAGKWVENIYFPSDQNLTPGTYQFQVSSNGFEAWILEIFIDGELVTTSTGLTDSGWIAFEVPEQF